MAFCKNCGKELKKGETCSCETEVRFCKGCGKKLVGNEVCDCAKSKSNASGSFDFVGTMKEIKDDLLAVFKKPVTVVEENTDALNMPKTYLSLATLVISFGLFIIGMIKMLIGLFVASTGGFAAITSAAMKAIKIPYFKFFFMGAVIFALTILSYAIVMLLVSAIFKNKKLSFKETLTLTVSAYLPMVWVNVVCALLGLIGLNGGIVLILYLIPAIIVSYNFVYAYAKYTNIEANKFGYAIAVLLIVAGIISGICSYAVTSAMGDSISSGFELDEDYLEDLEDDFDF